MDEKGTCLSMTGVALVSRLSGGEEVQTGVAILHGEGSGAGGLSQRRLARPLLRVKRGPKIDRFEHEFSWKISWILKLQWFHGFEWSLFEILSQILSGKEMVSYVSWICMVFIGDTIRHGLSGKHGIRQRRVCGPKPPVASSDCVSPGGLGAFKSRQP